MTSQPRVAALSALLLLGAAAPVLADPFTLNPRAANLNGTGFTADTFVLSDQAQIRFGDNGTTFVDTGYLPVIGFRLNGQAVSPAGYLAADGSGWGAYIGYTGTGTQIVSPQGIPVSATFETLSYTLVGYNGTASFGFAPDGSAIVGGAVSGVTPLETGFLISGQLMFTVLPDQFAPTIVGLVQATINEIEPQFIEGKPSAFNVTFVHPPGEYFFSSATTLQIAGGTSSSAALEFGKGGSGNQPGTVPLPEPASVGLLAAGLLGLAAHAARRRPG